MGNLNLKTNTKNLTQEINQFAFPLIASHFLDLIIAQIALGIAGRSSVESLSGISTIQNLLFALGGIFGAFSYAFTIKSSKVKSGKNNKKFLEYLLSSLMITGIIGVLFIILTIFGGRILLTLIYGFKGELLKKSTIYLLFMSPYILLILLSFNLTNLVKIEKKTGWIMKASFVASILEVILNLLLVNGNWGFPKLGIVGAAVSSIISLLVMVFIYFLLTKKIIFASLKSKPKALKELFSFGLPLAGQEILEGVLFIIIFEGVLSRLGVTTLAIYAVCAQVIAISKMPVYMYGNAVSVFSSEGLGEKNPRKVNQTYAFSLKSSYWWYFGISLVALILMKPITSFFSTSHVVQEESGLYFLIVAVCFLGTPLYEISKYQLQAREEEQFVLKMTFVLNLLSIGLILLLQQLGKTSFLELFIINGLTVSVLGIFFYLKEKKLREKTVIKPLLNDSL